MESTNETFVYTRNLLFNNYLGGSHDACRLGAGGRSPPAEGRPASFSGAVGEGFTIAASADRSVLQTGDPIRVVNQLSGPALAEFLATMVTTFTGFHPLGVVLVALLGVGDRSFAEVSEGDARCPLERGTGDRLLVVVPEPRDVGVTPQLFVLDFRNVLDFWDLRLRRLRWLRLLLFFPDPVAVVGSGSSSPRS